MFTPGRIAFIIFFVIVFGVALFFAYGKDKKKNPALFKNAWQILVGGFLIYMVLFFVTRLIH